METIRASVIQVAEKHFIVIESEEQIKIPMSENRPNEVKKAFNRLVARIREGEFQIELEEAGEDLFSQVAIEYIKQLNLEIREVHTEMKQNGLTNE